MDLLLYSDFDQPGHANWRHLRHGNLEIQIFLRLLTNCSSSLLPVICTISAG
jgi:hypothetical protein